MDVNQTLTTWRETLETSFREAFDQIIALTPNVVGMLLVLVVGYIIARLLNAGTVALAEALRFQTAAEQSGLAQSMEHVGIRKSVPWVLGRIVFWLTICAALTVGFNILGLDKVSEGMDKIVAFIPNVLVATVVVVVGLLLASFVRGVVATSADRVGLTYAEHLANGCYYVLALLTFIGAFDQLGIELGLLKELILIAFGAVAFGFGIALGLGGREVMGGILAGYYTRQRLQSGDRVTIAGMEGTVREVGPVATVIETDEHGLLNRHSVPNTRMLNEAIR